ncbi:MAG TPA: isochorismatase family cysteine hydrolase [Tepidisphaeraceae bacterium]|jgi:nicotinamidase-related amidase|nr:isochorismatase family cysteine hydrolase [Tepidisphaeraceae bacterium]
MPLTKLDVVGALVVIDLQKGIVGMPTVHPTGEIVERAARMARAFRGRGWPVVWVHVTGVKERRTDAGPGKFTPAGDWAEIVEGVGREEGDHVVEKRTWGAFLGTDLDAYLRGRGVSQVFMAGIATSIGVESTARSAYDLGYHVVFVLDAMTDRDAESHRQSVEKIFPRMGETVMAEEVVERVGSLAG